MGSFAFTCGISNLPIEAGDKVRYLMLTRNPYEDNLKCYSTGEWFPRAFPLRAVYNDYGSVEEIEKGANADSWYDGLKLDLVEQPVGENQYHDVPTSKDMPWDDLLKALWEDRVRVKAKTTYTYWAELVGQSSPAFPPHGPEVPVRQMMIREDVWQTLVAVDITSDYGILCESKLDMASFHEGAKAAWKLLTGPSKFTEASPEALRDVLYEMQMADLRMDGHPLAQSILRNTVPSTLGLATSFGFVARRFREGTMKLEEVEPFLDCVAEFMHMETVLSLARYLWRPSYSCGPQFGEWKLHVDVLSRFTNIALDIAKKKDEDQ